MIAKNFGAKSRLLVIVSSVALLLPLAGNAQDILRDTLPNGLQVIIVHNKLAPVVTTMVNYRVGSDETPPGLPGTAHATEHMMFRGSPGMSADQLAAISAAMGGDDNADTQQAVTQYFFTTTADNVGCAAADRGFADARDLLSDPKLWEKERGAIELWKWQQDLSNPTYVFYTQLLSAMSGVGRLMNMMRWAHAAVRSRRLTTADLRAFHNAWYVPNNAVLVIVGSVNPRTTMTLVKDLVGKIPAKKLPERPAFNFQPVEPGDVVVEHFRTCRMV